MYALPSPVESLIDEFSRLPGIGVKTAQRLTFYLLRSPLDQSRSLSEAVARMKETVLYCSHCYNITENDPCPICSNAERDTSSICVVEEPLDAFAIEKTGVYRGVYHVLHGALSPAEGIGPSNLRIAELIERIHTRQVEELILATNPNFEGEYTAAYIRSQLEGLSIHITSLARGLPLGGDLEYADEGTLSRALEGRR